MAKIIYSITNITNNDIYVGQTIQGISARFSQHRKLSNSGSNSHLHRAIRKYGFDNFKCDILEILDESTDINERECHWISKLKPAYNMTPGGEGVKGLKLSEEHKAAISRHMMGHTPWNKDKTDCYTQEQLDRISNGMKTSYKSKNRVPWNKGIPSSTSAQIGKDSAEKLRAIATGRKRKYLPNGKWTWEYPKSGS